METEARRKELETALLSENPEETFQMLQKQGALKKLLPELENCVNFDQHHPKHHLDVFEHTLAVVAATPQDLVLRWAALLHDISKPLTRTIDEHGIGHFYGHDEMSADMARKILTELNYPAEFIDQVNSLIHYHMIRLHVHTEKAVGRFTRKLGIDGVEKLIQLFKADRSAHKQVDGEDIETEFEKIYRRLCSEADETDK
jgi:tRNA nucleotidyltransferase (CCA-adding enzyme)